MNKWEDLECWGIKRLKVNNKKWGGGGGGGGEEGEKVVTNYAVKTLD